MNNLLSHLDVKINTKKKNRGEELLRKSSKKVRETGLLTSKSARIEETPRAVEQPAAVATLSVEDIREAVAAELARAQTANTPQAAGNHNSAQRRRGRGQARGWGRGRWINFGCYLPHPGPYTPFCRAHREAGCSVCMYFCPNINYMNPADNNWAIEN